MAMEKMLLLVKFQAFNKSNTPPWVFFTFLNCINDIKSRNASHVEAVARKCSIKEFLKFFTGKRL